MLRQRTRRVVISVVFVLAMLGVVSFALRTYLKIRSGHATDTYENVYRFHIPWSQAAGFLVSAPLILLGIFAVRQWQLWRRSRQEGVSIRTVVKDLKRNS